VKSKPGYRFFGPHCTSFTLYHWMSSVFTAVIAHQQTRYINKWTLRWIHWWDSFRSKCHPKPYQQITRTTNSNCKYLHDQAAVVWTTTSTNELITMQCYFQSNWQFYIWCVVFVPWNWGDSVQSFSIISVVDRFLKMCPNAFHSLRAIAEDYYLLFILN